MILKGIVSSIENNGVRVTFKEKENIVSGTLSKAQHVDILEVGNNVVVAFFNNSKKSGIIIAKY